MMSTGNVARAALGICAALVAAGCGSGGAPGGDTSKSTSTISGIVVQAPVSGATVTAYKLDASMTRGAVLGTATTATGTSGGSQAAGTFDLSLSPYNGPLEIVASAGTYVDEATGVVTQMAGYDISAVVGNYQAGTAVTATISPISSLAAAFARFDVKAHGTSVSTAVDTAYTHLNAHFGAIDWRKVVPADLGGITNLTAEATAALILASLSDEASQVATSTGGAAGVSVTAAILSQMLAQDAATGVLDGLGPSGQLTLGTLANSYQPDGRTARYFLATSLQHYVQAHPALSGLTGQVSQLANAISANSDPYLFNSPGLALNTQPPPVTLVAPGAGAGPYYVNTDTVSVAATATAMGNGVAAVYAVVQGSANPIPATLNTSANPAAWQVSVPVTAGTNVVKLYAVDNAGQGGIASCSPAGGAAPSNCVTVTIVQDKMSPAVALSGSAPATYYDESTMTVGAAAPPVYNGNGAKPVTLGAGAAVHKAATRLAPTSTKGPADLEGTNPDNLPWLQFVVSLTGAPLANATYTIKASAASTTNTFSGDLLPWLSPSSKADAATGNVYFDLPLDSVRIPMLTGTLGTVMVSVSATVADVAGNSAPLQNSATLQYSVIGGPLNIALDATYPTANAPNSTYPYAIGNGSYGALFNFSDFATFGGSRQVRLLRYLVTNPAPVPVALTVPTFSGGSWTMSESWSGLLGPAKGTIAFNNSTCPGDNACAASHASMYTPPGGSTACNNDPGPAGAAWSGTAASSSGLSTLAYVLQNGYDTQPAIQVGGRYIVPAAAGTTPGVLALYVTRPLTASRAVALGAYPYQQDTGAQLYTFASEGNSSIGCCASGYLTSTTYTCSQGVSYDKQTYCSTSPCASGWSSSAVNWCTTPPASGCGAGSTPATCTNCTGTCSCDSWVQQQTYNTYSYYRQLAQASEAITGSFTPVTFGSDAQGNVYGAASSGAPAVTMNGSASH